MTASFVWLSYHNFDLERALAISGHLQSEGVQIVFDYFQTNKQPDAVINALQQADGFIALFSPAYLQSPYCRQELEEAHNRNIPIYPILLEPISLELWPTGLSLSSPFDFSYENTLADAWRALKQAIRDNNAEAINPALPPIAESVYDIIRRFNITDNLLYHLEVVNLEQTVHQYRPILTQSQEYLVQDRFMPIRQAGAYQGRNTSLRLMDLFDKYQRLVICGNHASAYLGQLGASIARKHVELAGAYPQPYWVDCAVLDEDGLSVDHFIDLIRQQAAHIAREAIVLLDHIDSLWQRTDRNALLQEIVALIPSGCRVVCASQQPSLIPLGFEQCTLDTAAIERELSQEQESAAANQLWTQTRTVWIQSRNPVLAQASYLVQADPPIASLSAFIQLLTERMQQKIGLNSRFSGISPATLQRLLIKAAKYCAFSADAHRIARVRGHVQDEPVLAAAIATGLLNVRNGQLRFIDSTIQAHYLNQALDEEALIEQIRPPAIHNHQQRLTQIWDEAIHLLTQAAAHKDHLLIQVAEKDPYLALECVTRGAAVTASTYSVVMQHTLHQLREGGDNRLVLANSLIEIDAPSAQALLLEVARNAAWGLRLLATDRIIELGIDCSPGLEEALQHPEVFAGEERFATLWNMAQASLPALLRELREGNTQRRRTAAWILGELRDKAAVPALVATISDNHRDVAITALQAVSKIEQLPNAIEPARTNAPSLDVLSRVAQTATQPDGTDIQVDAIFFNALKRLIPDLPEALLLQLSYHSNADVRSVAIEGLRNHMMSPNVVQRLAEAITDYAKSRWSKKSIAEIASMAVANKPEKVDASASATLGKERLLKVRTSTTEAIAVMAEESTAIPVPSNPAPHLNGRIQEEFQRILREIRHHRWTDTNGRLGNVRALIQDVPDSDTADLVPHILTGTRDENWIVRWACVESLGLLKDNRAIEAALNSLKDQQWQVRVAAIRALEEMNNSNAAPHIALALADDNQVVREAAAEALGRCSDEKSIPYLMNAAVADEPFVRIAAVEALGNIKAPAAQMALITALQDPSDHVRWAAINALVETATPAMVGALSRSLSDTGGPYWEQKRICDVAAAILEKLGSYEAQAVLNVWKNRAVEPTLHSAGPV